MAMEASTGRSADVGALSHPGGTVRSLHQLVDLVLLPFELGEGVTVQFPPARQPDLHGIDEMSVDDHFVMEVRSGREARIAQVPDHLPLLDPDAGSNPVGEAR